MDVIYNLINNKRFFKYNYEEKIELKGKGRLLPNIIIVKKVSPEKSIPETTGYAVVIGKMRFSAFHACYLVAKRLGRKTKKLKSMKTAKVIFIIQWNWLY